MIRNTGNKEVIRMLQSALEAFLWDHYQHAKNDPEFAGKTAEQIKCKCDDCIAVRLLLRRI